MVEADALIALTTSAPDPAVAAIVGLGYVPARSPPAAPAGATPEINVLLALVKRPFASTVNVPE